MDEWTGGQGFKLTRGQKDEGTSGQGEGVNKMTRKQGNGVDGVTSGQVNKGTS